jgi:hypothetical protein
LRRLLITLVLLALLVAGLQYLLQDYGERELHQALAHTRGWADIQVRDAHFWIWGEVDLDDVDIRPSALYAADLGLPLADDIHFDRVRLHRPRFAFAGWTPYLKSLRLDLRGLDTPVPDWAWNITVAHDSAGAPMWAPTLRDLGIDTLKADVRVDADFSHGLRRPDLVASTRLPDLAALRGGCLLDLRQATLASPDALRIERCRVHYHDLGLMQRFETTMAKRNAIGIDDLRQRIADQVRVDARQAEWPPLNTQAVQDFVRQPGDLILKMNPPAPLALDQIPRNVWRGLPQLLGLTAEQPSVDLGTGSGNR